MNVKIVKSAWTSVAIAAALGASAAQAESVMIDIGWTDYYGVAHTADFTVYASPIAGSPGEYSADAISGTYAGQAITGLTSVYRLPDQILYAPVTGMSAVDSEGLAFSFGGRDANFRYNNNGYVIADNKSTYYDAAIDAPSITFSSAPEPASWALMLIGFGAAGGAIRRLRRRGAALAVA